MIGKDKIAEAIRYADALSEEHNDLPGYWRERGVDVEGLSYVAMQRGLRGVVVLKGGNPNSQKRLPVKLTGSEERFQMMLAAAFMDGFAARDAIKGVDHKLIGDIQNSYELAMRGYGVAEAAIEEIAGTVTDYLGNHYGDED